MLRTGLFDVFVDGSCTQKQINYLRETSYQETHSRTGPKSYILLVENQSWELFRWEQHFWWRNFTDVVNGERKREENNIKDKIKHYDNFSLVLLIKIFGTQTGKRMQYRFSYLTKMSKRAGVEYKNKSTFFPYWTLTSKMFCGCCEQKVCIVSVTARTFTDTSDWIAA